MWSCVAAHKRNSRWRILLAHMPLGTFSNRQNSHTCPDGPPPGSSLPTSVQAITAIGGELSWARRRDLASRRRKTWAEMEYQSSSRRPSRLVTQSYHMRRHEGDSQENELDWACVKRHGSQWRYSGKLLITAPAKSFTTSTNRPPDTTQHNTTQQNQSVNQSITRQSQKKCRRRRVSRVWGGRGESWGRGSRERVGGGLRV